MTIEQLEQYIKESGSLMAMALLEYELSGCLGDRGAADAHKFRMEAAIARRVALEKDATA